MSFHLLRTKIDSLQVMIGLSNNLETVCGFVARQKVALKLVLKFMLLRSNPKPLKVLTVNSLASKETQFRIN